MNTLRSALQDYLNLRRGLGYKMNDAGRLLPRFVSFLQARQEPHITAQSALQWAQQAKVQPAEWARRLGFVRGLARYRSAADHLQLGPGAHVRVIGKGRKERCTPLSKSTRAVLTAWTCEPQKVTGQPVFPTRKAAD